MYKTVRHGENSLQYTILPQTEEVLSNSGLKGKGRDYSPSIHVRRSRRKQKVQLTLVLVTSLIIAIALLCASIYCLDWINFDRWLNVHETVPVSTERPRIYLEPSNSKTRKKELKISPEIISTLQSRFEASTTTTAYATTSITASTMSSTVKGEKPTTPPWIMPALRSWKSSSTIQAIPTEGNENPTNGKQTIKKNLKEKTAIDNMSIKPWEKDIIIRPTVTPEPITLRSVIRFYSPSFISEKPAAANTKVFDDVLITTKGTTTRMPVESTSEQSKLNDLKDTMLSVDDDDEFKESLEVDEVFSLPPLKPESGFANSDSDEVTVSKTDGGWYGARWPFVDTSSYFQWTGYSPGDNLLLPLLVAALSSLALVLLLALAVRRRRRVTIRIGKLPSEIQEEDNTNLLTAENGENAEE